VSRDRVQGRLPAVWFPHRLAPGASEGGVVCLCRERLPITKTISAIPAGLV
jgi:hypothetical protein